MTAARTLTQKEFDDLQVVPVGVPMTADEYLKQERLAETKSEYWDGKVYAMAGTSPKHGYIHSNLMTHLSAQIREYGCMMVGSDFRVFNPAKNSYTYPDLVVFCGDAQLKDEDNLLNPKVAIEILSPSTERYDRGVKLRNARAIDSLEEQILISQTEPIIDHFVKQANGTWTHTVLITLDNTLKLATLPAEISLRDVYFRVFDS